MTDNLRDAAQAVLDRWDSLDWKAAPTADYMNRLRAALAAAPQPAPEREALVEVIRSVVPLSVKHLRTLADALLARGLRLPGEETMAWAVVGEDGKIDPRKLWINSRDAEEYCERGERAVRVAIRAVEAGGDAA